MSKRIVIATWGSFGDVNPSLALALGLKTRGHVPVIATLNVYRDYVTSAGIEFRPLGPHVPDDKELVRRIMDARTGTELLLRELLFPAIRESYAELLEAVRGADLLVTHPVTFAGPLVAEKTGMPWISTVLSPISFFSAYDMPVFAPMPALAKVRALGPNACRLVLGLGRRMTRDWSEPVRRFRAELGLPPRGDPLYEGQFSPFGTLALFSRVIAEPQPDWPPNSRVTGFLFHDTGIGGDRLSPELQRFLGGGLPPVVFTLGTSAVMAAGNFYRESQRAAQLAGCRSVLLIGRDPANRPPAPLPADVFCCEHAPYAKLFPRAAAVVHSGGIGTTGQVLRAGRPMLVVPFAHDQPDNAARVTRLGVARTLYPRRYTVQRVAHELRVLLEESRYATRAAEIAREVRSEDGVTAACDAIDFSWATESQ